MYRNPDDLLAAIEHFRIWPYLTLGKVVEQRLAETETVARDSEASKPLKHIKHNCLILVYKIVFLYLKLWRAVKQKGRQSRTKRDPLIVFTAYKLLSAKLLDRYPRRQQLSQAPASLAPVGVLITCAVYRCRVRLRSCPVVGSHSCVLRTWAELSKHIIIQLRSTFCELSEHCTSTDVVIYNWVLWEIW